MFQVVDRPKLYEQVVEQIKNMIVQGIYKKGDLLPSEKELIEMTGVSRITVREALRLLNEAGVIETHKGKGSFVVVDGSELESGEEETEAYNEQFINSTNARILLEPSVVKEIAVTATDEELKAIAGCIGSKGYEDGEFHRSIIAATHNPVLLQWFDQLNSMETSPCHPQPCASGAPEKRGRQDCAAASGYQRCTDGKERGVCLFLYEGTPGIHT